MLLNPPALFMMIILVAITGLVGRGLMVSWFKLRREEKFSPTATELDERLKRIEAAISGVLTDVSAMREKERFTARLQASALSRETQSRQESTKESDISPLATQTVPVIPRARS